MVRDSFQDDDVAPIRMEAFDWAARLALGPVSDADRRAFDTWHASSPAHAEAYRSTAEFMEDLRALDLPVDQLGADPIVVPFEAPARRLDRRMFLAGGAMAASLAACAVAIRPPLGLWPGLDEYMADERTGLAERRTFSPMAGVGVELNARTSLSRIDDGLKLIVGEAFVDIRNKDLPFHVKTSRVLVTARHASFNVNDLGSNLCVSCITGSLAVANADGGRTLREGEAMTWHEDGRMSMASADPATAAAWRRGLLVFKSTPLESVIGEINRYYPGKLVLRASALASRPVTGVFHVDQIKLAVIQIQRLTNVRTTSLPGGIVLFG